MTVDEVKAIETFMLHLREIFFESMERKTGWGKEEVKVQFNLSLTSALIRTIKLEETP